MKQAPELQSSRPVCALLGAQKDSKHVQSHPRNREESWYLRSEIILLTFGGEEKLKSSEGPRPRPPPRRNWFSSRKLPGGDDGTCFPHWALQGGSASSRRPGSLRAPQGWGKDDVVFPTFFVPLSPWLSGEECGPLLRIIFLNI